MPLKNNSFSIFFLLFLIFYSLPCNSNTVIVNEENIELLINQNPKDIDLLFMYAVLKQKRGDFHDSLNIMESIISIGTDNILHYLELAKLQFYNHDHSKAEKNFLYVYNKNIPSNFKSNIRNYLRIINRSKPSKFNYNFKISYNDNINNGTYSDTIKLFGVPFTIDENAKAKESYELYTGIDYTQQFILDNYRLNVGGKIDHSNFSNKNYDRLKLSLFGGPELYFKNHKIKIDLTLSREEMNEKNLSNFRDLTLNHYFNYNPNIMLNSSLSLSKNNYYNNSVYNTEGFSLKTGLSYISHSGVNYGIIARYSDSKANEKIYGNDKKYISASIGSKLPYNFYVDISYGLEKTKYDAFQLIWLTTREDKLELIQLSLKNERLYFRSFYPQLNFTIRDNYSNVDVYKTSSNSVSLYFIKDF